MVGRGGDVLRSLGIVCGYCGFMRKQVRLASGISCMLEGLDQVVY